jgi:TRAP-type mannitol/chloroaromatic compound transport system substrate-binding protein
MEERYNSQFDPEIERLMREITGLKKWSAEILARSAELQKRLTAAEAKSHAVNDKLSKLGIKKK